MKNALSVVIVSAFVLTATSALAGSETLLHSQSSKIKTSFGAALPAQMQLSYLEHNYNEGSPNDPDHRDNSPAPAHDMGASAEPKKPDLTTLKLIYKLEVTDKVSGSKDAPSTQKISCEVSLPLSEGALASEATKAYEKKDWNKVVELSAKQKKAFYCFPINLYTKNYSIQGGVLKSEPSITADGSCPDCGVIKETFKKLQDNRDCPDCKVNTQMKKHLGSESTQPAGSGSENQPAKAPAAK